jgi:hypothetical protein
MLCGTALRFLGAAAVVAVIGGGTSASAAVRGSDAIDPGTRINGMLVVWLYDYAPAGGRDVVLREWSIVLFGAIGRHSIRFRNRLPQGVLDTTWNFSVAR